MISLLYESFSLWLGNFNWRTSCGVSYLKPLPFWEHLDEFFFPRVYFNQLILIRTQVLWSKNEQQLRISSTVFYRCPCSLSPINRKTAIKRRCIFITRASIKAKFMPCRHRCMNVLVFPKRFYLHTTAAIPNKLSQPEAFRVVQAL